MGSQGEPTLKANRPRAPVTPRPDHNPPAINTTEAKKKIKKQFLSSIKSFGAESSPSEEEEGEVARMMREGRLLERKRTKMSKKIQIAWNQME